MFLTATFFELFNNSSLHLVLEYVNQQSAHIISQFLTITTTTTEEHNDSSRLQMRKGFNETLPYCASEMPPFCPYRLAGNQLESRPSPDP